MPLHSKEQSITYAWVGSQSNTNGANQCTLACPIRSDDHVQARSKKVLRAGIRDKVCHFHAKDRARLKGIVVVVSAAIGAVDAVHASRVRSGALSRFCAVAVWKDIVCGL